MVNGELFRTPDGSREKAHVSLRSATGAGRTAEEALLPHPVKLRDMILRKSIGTGGRQFLNHNFQQYLAQFGELQKLARRFAATGNRAAQDGVSRRS
jgi:hypothetical protein